MAVELQVVLTIGDSGLGNISIKYGQDVAKYTDILGDSTGFSRVWNSRAA
jgi:hypothetical protein